MKLKIHGWNTRSGEQQLCKTCSNAFIRKGTAHDQEVVMCEVMFEVPVRITYPIVECNKYRNANLPSLSDMNKIAWFLNSDKTTGRIGFTKPERVTEVQKEEVTDANPFR